ncbi:MAG TPA: FKBP-type peptidyl-prolyl cis-trans isomerase [Bacteroidia bacterium]|nr:FKBP-type peptidyl-prolyl cis-trans isomerase [Bacteroidia bacterium]
MKKTILIAGSVSTLLFAACNSSEFEGFSKAENGLYYHFFSHDENGSKVQEGDAIILRYVIKKQENDSIIVDSKNVSRDGSGYANLAPVTSSFPGSLEDGLKMMSVGDSAEFIISADSFFLKTQKVNELPAGFKPGQHILAVFKLKEITPKAQVEAMRKKQMEEREVMMKDFQAKEQPAIEKYLIDNKITVKPSASGLYYMESKKGSGDFPKASDVVKVHYTGMLLDGTIFDSSVERGEPAEFPLNGVIPGWTEGLQLMKKGGKAKLLLPSSIAYGPNGAGERIPPYSPLLFEVELLDIKAAPAAPQAPQAPGK